MQLDKEKLLGSIRKVPDYPKPGILFYDITTMIGDASVFGALIDSLAARYAGRKIDYIAAIESRGFIFGAALANALGVGFVPIRKKGKLPFTTISEKYALEYGFDEVEIHIDAFGDNASEKNVLLIDDLLATGGTASAAVKLISSTGAKCVEACFILNLKELNGESKLQKLTDVFCVLDI